MPRAATETTSATPALYRWADRPAILEACRSLGINDRRVARLLGIQPEQVHAWVAGKRPIPHKYLLALAFLIGRLTGEIVRMDPPADALRPPVHHPFAGIVGGPRPSA